MPTFVSKDGVWYVGKERVALRNNSNNVITNPSAEWSKFKDEKVNPGEQFIYEGPDRAALFELHKLDKTGQIVTLGQHFTDDVDLQDRTRQRGYKSVAEYAKAFGWSKEKSDNQFEKLIAKVETHDLPKRVEMVKAAQSGGTNTAGSDFNREGGFGEPPKEI